MVYLQISWESLLTGFLIGILALVIGNMIYDAYFRKAKITIKALQKGDKLGFSVKVERKTIKDAIVRCNNKNYPWEFSENGKDIKTDKKNLYPGDVPSLFFPFQTTWEYVPDVSKCQMWSNVDEISKRDGVAIYVKEIITQTIVYSEGFVIPKDAEAMWAHAQYARKPIFSASIRIVGEGIDEERDYYLRIGLSNLIVPAIREGKPIMDYVTAGFELKKKHFWS